jgi:preprotein translocase subunit YajC
MILSLLAQTQGPASPPPPSPWGAFFPMALIMAFFVFIMLNMRSQKKREQQAKEQMYDRLQKNQRILTVGGVIGTVMSVKDNEVVVKVDEANNTKMTFIKSAIQRILDEEQTASPKR